LRDQRSGQKQDKNDEQELINHYSHGYLLD
jgi:hypothetical protein